MCGTDIVRLLFIDSYDSFTFNLAALCREAIPNCSIYIVKNDAFTFDEILCHLPLFSAIVIGPGPGSPDNLPDIGIVKDLWKLSDRYLLPIFGVCLGLQSLGIEFGATLHRLKVVKHGQMSNIYHTGTEIFEDVGQVQAVRYHSLHIELHDRGPIEELAWTEDEEDGKVVMAIRHKTKPFWAVQYHPESVCTNGGGIEVVDNFWKLAQSWSQKTLRQPCSWTPSATKTFGQSWPPQPQKIPHSPTALSERPIHTNALHLPYLSTVAVCEALDVSDTSSRFALLESAAQPGRYSIVASLLPSSMQVTHYVGENYLHLTRDGTTEFEPLGSQDVWSWLGAYMGTKSHLKGHPDIPFWGGFIGLLSYEAGTHSIHVPLRRDPDCETKRHPDVNLIYVERSVVLDSVTGQVYIQSLIEGDDAWISDVSAKLTLSSESEADLKVMELKPQSGISPATVILPDKAFYIERILQAKEHLYAGDSYELCLTAPTTVTFNNAMASDTPTTTWDRYKRLRESNPAPHSAYLRLQPTTLLSSSPERFLSYSRPPGTICQLRPIKGTVRTGPGITRAMAEAALSGSVKEVAENLMIVDLIRHDLHAVVGADVRVKQFCKVEEYETVWQLVSVIVGTQGTECGAADLGWKVLKSSLPPGSMTGAPKKRSVEILQTLEDQERGVYSGVFGYWCVGGSGDWSVTIRSCFNYNDASQPCEDLGGEKWVIGAGGAITALSDPEAEWEEMVIKLQSVLRSFGVGPLTV